MKFQAYVIDMIQATRVQMAIRWGVRPEDIALTRVHEEVRKELDARAREQIVGWVL